MADQRPAVFIGSSSEGILVAKEIELQLSRFAEANVWQDDVFKLGMGTLETLASRLDSFDFAVFVLSPDDKIRARGRSYSSPRDNVLFELGLFMGKLGRGRAFVVHTDGANLKLPSDLAGITMSRYDTDGHLASAVSRACLPILRAIKELGLSDSRRTASADKVLEDLLSPDRLHSYKSPGSENAAKQARMFDACASRSMTARYLVLRGRDILSSKGEIARLTQNAGPHLKVQLLMVDFESLSRRKFDEIRQSMALKWDLGLEAEKKWAKNQQLTTARDLSRRKNGFLYRLLPADMVPELKLRLYDHSGFFTFYRRNTGRSEVQNRPIFYVEDKDPSKGDYSPLRLTLDRWFEELWNLSREPQ
jgi:hypothetical protein